MVIQKKVSFIIALLILHLAAFAQAENENRTDEYGGEALGFLLERSAYVKTSDYPYEYEERNYFLIEILTSMTDVNIWHWKRIFLFYCMKQLNI